MAWIINRTAWSKFLESEKSSEQLSNFEQYENWQTVETSSNQVYKIKMSEDVAEGEFCRDNPSTTTQTEEDFSEEQRDELLEAFTLYDKDEDGLISTREIATVMRALGQVPTICEETDIVAEFAIEQCNEIDFKAFRNLTRKRMRDFDEDYELRESFRRFDKEEKGKIKVNWLRLMLTSIGEPLTNEEVDKWLGDAEEFIKNGDLNYEAFATRMLSK